MLQTYNHDSILQVCSISLLLTHYMHVHHLHSFWHIDTSSCLFVHHSGHQNSESYIFWCHCGACKVKKISMYEYGFQEVESLQELLSKNVQERGIPHVCSIISEEGPDWECLIHLTLHITCQWNYKMLLCTIVPISSPCPILASTESSSGERMRGIFLRTTMLMLPRSWWRSIVQDKYLQQHAAHSTVLYCGACLIEHPASDQSDSLDFGRHMKFSWPRKIHV